MKNFKIYLKFWIAGILSFAIFIFIIWSPKPFVLVHTPVGDGLIIAFGDSLTEGVGASSPENSYPSVLARKLGREVVNAGRSGDTTFEAIARLNHEVIALQPRLVIITIGGNDILNKIPSETVAANLAAIVMPLHAAGAMVAFVDISPPAGGWTMKFLKRQNREMGVLNLEGIMDDIWKNPELMSDSVHPNDKGYALIAERIAEKIMPHLTTIKNP